MLFATLETASRLIAAGAEPWFEPNAFGAYYGAAMGAGGGTLAGALGALAGWLAPRGKGRGIVFGGLYFLLAVGVLNHSFGILALTLGQPPTGSGIPGSFAASSSRPCL